MAHCSGSTTQLLKIESEAILCSINLLLDHKLLKGREPPLFIFVSPASTWHTSQSTSVELNLFEFISRVTLPELGIELELKAREESFISHCGAEGSPLSNSSHPITPKAASSSPRKGPNTILLVPLVSVLSPNSGKEGK